MNQTTVVEAVAIALWNHFGSPHRIEWQDETHQEEFRNAARVAISAYRTARLQLAPTIHVNPESLTDAE